MTPRLTIAILAATLGLNVAAVRAQNAPAASSAQAQPDLRTLVGNLGSLDYPTRMNAARLLRRAPQAEVVPVLADAVRRHPDEYARYRAFVVLSGFNDRATPPLVREILGDRNDRLREVAYKWLEQHPDRQLAPTLVAALQTEQAEFVRPALVAALTSLADDSAVQRALLVEVGRGLDFFRSAVIDALGQHHAAFALDAIAPVTKNEGPLQQDAVLAIGRIGGARAVTLLGDVMGPPDVMLSVRAAQCLAGAPCDPQITALADAAIAPRARLVVVQSAVGGLVAIAQTGNKTAIESLLQLPSRVGALRDVVASGFATLAVRRPAVVIDWLDAASEPARTAAIALLKDGFDSLEEDFGEEQFFAAARAAYWQAPEGASMRTLSATLIQRLEF